jgi:hypothetical protein
MFRETRLNVAMLAIGTVMIWPAFVAAAPQGKDERSILAATTALEQARTTWNPQAMAIVMAADYVEISPIGDVDEREEVLGFYSAEAKVSAGNPTNTLTISEERVRLYGNQAVVILKEAITVSGDKPRLVVFRVSVHLRKIGKKWMVDTLQYTGERKPAP